MQLSAGAALVGQAEGSAGVAVAKPGSGPSKDGLPGFGATFLETLPRTLNSHKAPDKEGLATGTSKKTVLAEIARQGQAEKKQKVNQEEPSVSNSSAAESSQLEGLTQGTILRLVSPAKDPSRASEAGDEALPSRRKEVGLGVSEGCSLGPANSSATNSLGVEGFARTRAGLRDALGGHSNDFSSSAAASRSDASNRVPVPSTGKDAAAASTIGSSPEDPSGQHLEGLGMVWAAPFSRSPIVPDRRTSGSGAGAAHQQATGGSSPAAGPPDGVLNESNERHATLSPSESTVPQGAIAARKLADPSMPSLEGMVNLLPTSFEEESGVPHQRAPTPSMDVDPPHPDSGHQLAATPESRAKVSELFPEGRSGQNAGGGARLEDPVTSLGGEVVRPSIANNSAAALHLQNSAPAGLMTGQRESGSSFVSTAFNSLGDTFSQIDLGEVSTTHLWHANPHLVEVGMNDPVHGWLEIRAQGAAGQVTASLSATTPDAHAALHAQLSGMADYLAERELGVHSLEVRNVLANEGGGLNGNSSGAHSERGPGQGASGNNDSLSAPELASGSRSSRRPDSTSNASLDLRESLSASSALESTGSSRWINVRV
ncbi:hypothetical protein ACPOL_0133 [Acidisarcina polymorpha]|uniref:Flagellar hook-length control protein FliK n=1 Tax=Acidisarcina polymorpha TaxID=2211140 RepID=A0A2Z5FS07_9BACT|nr:hypothetical protein [Acidisarcina polymorpha]AXC09518.1 hypothetical protein ACPOL_0133 [Acidisarcina polymorpha]